MKSLKSAIIIGLLAMVVATMDSAKAQTIFDNTIFYHSFRAPMSSHINPTLFPYKAQWYVSLPNLDLGLSLPFSYNDLGLYYDPQRDVSVLNLNHVIDQMSSNKLGLAVSSNVDLLGFGVRLADFATLHVASGLRTHNRIAIPMGIVEFLQEGNAGEQRQFNFGSDDILSSQTWMYASLGGSFRIPELPISIGATVNLLSGLQSFKVDQVKMDLTTADDMSYIQFTADYMAHSAGVAGLCVDDSGSLVFHPTLSMPQSWGVSMDVGARAKLGMVDLSVSLVDLGQGIFWQENPIAIVPKTRETTIRFDGIDVSQLLQDGGLNRELLSAWIDSLKNLPDYAVTEASHSMSIPTKLYFGASVTFLKMLRAGYLLHGEWDKKEIKTTFRCNNTLSLHANLMNWLEVAVANSFSYDGDNLNWFNPGASFMFSLGGSFQCYLAADFVSNMYLANMKSARLMVGVNIVGKHGKK